MPHTLGWLVETLAERTTNAVFTKDCSGRYLTMNSAGALTLGRPVEEIIGRTDDELWAPETARQTRHFDRLALASPTPLSYVHREQTGSRLRVWDTVKGALRDSSGACVGLFGVTQELTGSARVSGAARGELLENDVCAALFALRANFDVLEMGALSPSQRRAVRRMRECETLLSQLFSAAFGSDPDQAPAAVRVAQIAPSWHR